MKFKLQVNTGDLLQKVSQEVADKMPVNVMLDVETECTLEELRGLYELQKDALRETPELLKGFFENIASAIPAFNKFDKAVCNMVNGTESIAETSVTNAVAE